MDKLISTTNLARENAEALLLQVRQLHALSRKATAVNLVLTSYRDFLTDAVNDLRKHDDAVTKLGGDSEELSQGRLNKITQSQSFDKALSDQELFSRHLLEIIPADLVSAEANALDATKQDAYSALLKALNDLDRELDKVRTSHDYHDLFNQVQAFNKHFNDFAISRAKSRTTRSQKLRDLSKMKVRIDESVAFSNKILDDLSDRLAILVANVSTLNQTIERVAPAILPEDDDTILNDFVNSQTFGDRQKELNKQKQMDELKQKAENAKAEITKPKPVNEEKKKKKHFLFW